MAKCNFCGTTIQRGTGLIYVLKEGKAINYCSRKCEKNETVLRRKPANMKWTMRYSKE
jgi:large subunit ribosomal protein L24e